VSVSKGAGAAGRHRRGDPTRPEAEERYAPNSDFPSRAEVNVLEDYTNQEVADSIVVIDSRPRNWPDQALALTALTRPCCSQFKTANSIQRKVTYDYENCFYPSCCLLCQTAFAQSNGPGHVFDNTAQQLSRASHRNGSRPLPSEASSVRLAGHGRRHLQTPWRPTRPL